MKAARYIHEGTKSGDVELMFPSAPPLRLLADAFELVFKAYFRATGESVEQLKERGHDLERMWTAAVASGIGIPANGNIQEHLGLLNDFAGRSPYPVK